MYSTSGSSRQHRSAGKPRLIGVEPIQRGRKRSLQADKKFYFLLEAGPADGLQQV